MLLRGISWFPFDLTYSAQLNYSSSVVLRLAPNDGEVCFLSAGTTTSLIKRSEGRLLPLLQLTKMLYYRVVLRPPSLYLPTRVRVPGFKAYVPQVSLPNEFVVYARPRSSDSNYASLTLPLGYPSHSPHPYSAPPAPIISGSPQSHY